jgi:hypothetical protein
LSTGKTEFLEAFSQRILATSSDRTPVKNPVSLLLINAPVSQPAGVKGQDPFTLKNRPLLIYLEAGVSFMQNAT